MDDTREYLEALVKKVAQDLVHSYPRSDKATEYGLVFPRKRDRSLRISEQEAKFRFAHHLTIDQRFCFSVETPTSQTYRQKGTTDKSASIDLTLVGQDGQRLAHVEFKPHQPLVEHIRKDLEKLVREETMAVWFHVLERQDRRTLPLLMRKFRESFHLLKNHLQKSNGSYLMSFCVLEAGLLFWRWLQLTGELDRNLSAVESVFDERSLVNGSWTTHHFGDGQTMAHPVGLLSSKTLKQTSTGKGAREAFFVFAPSIASDTFVHLSTRGGSYRIRNFQETGPTIAPPTFTVPGYPTLEALRASGVIAQWLPVTAEDLLHSLEKEPGYWYERIRHVNSEGLPS